MNKTALFSLACLLIFSSACGWWRKKTPCCPPAGTIVAEQPATYSSAPVIVEDQGYTEYNAPVIVEDSTYREPVDPYYAQTRTEVDPQYVTEDQVAQAFPEDQAYGYSEELDQTVPLTALDQNNMHNHPNHRNKAVSLPEELPTQTVIDSEVDFLK